jgi:hypothetical protein
VAITHLSAKFRDAILVVGKPAPEFLNRESCYWQMLEKRRVHFVQDVGVGRSPVAVSVLEPRLGPLLLALADGPVQPINAAVFVAFLTAAVVLAATAGSFP